MSDVIRFTPPPGLVPGAGFLIADVLAWFQAWDIGATVTAIGVISGGLVMAYTGVKRKLIATQIELARLRTEAEIELLRKKADVEIQLARAREEAQKGTLTGKLTEMEKSQDRMRANLHAIRNEANLANLRYAEESRRHDQEAVRLTKQLDLVSGQLREANEQLRALRLENRELASKLTRAIVGNSQRIEELEATVTGPETAPPHPGDLAGLSPGAEGPDA